jgi:hypothetical protein
MLQFGFDLPFIVDVSFQHEFLVWVLRHQTLDHRIVSLSEVSYQFLSVWGSNTSTQRMVKALHLNIIPFTNGRLEDGRGCLASPCCLYRLLFVEPDLPSSRAFLSWFFGSLSPEHLKLTNFSTDSGKNQWLCSHLLSIFVFNTYNIYMTVLGGSAQSSNVRVMCRSWVMFVVVMVVVVVVVVGGSGVSSTAGQQRFRCYVASALQGTACNTGTINSCEKSSWDVLRGVLRQH